MNQQGTHDGAPTAARPRMKIDWYRNKNLKVLKMLAWVVWDCEEVRNAGRLWLRVAHLFPDVVEAITGEQGITLEQVCEETLADQGHAITPKKLLHRADKTERYDEVNEYSRKVREVYTALQRARDQQEPVRPLTEDALEHLAEDAPTEPVVTPEADDAPEHPAEDAPDERNVDAKTSGMSVFTSILAHFGVN